MTSILKFKHKEKTQSRQKKTRVLIKATNILK